MLIHLGEVDCDFVFWWRAMKYGECVEGQLEGGLDAYGTFLNKIKLRGFRNPADRDQHLDKNKVAGVWATKCNNLVVNAK